MHNETTAAASRPDGSVEETISYMLKALHGGTGWPTALVSAMARWKVPEEEVDGQRMVYLIAGEAFDWLLLAQRLLREAGDAVPVDEQEKLLFSGQLPDGRQESWFKELLGIDKYRAYMNFYYGVTVEEALQLATEEEIRKRHVSNGLCFREDISEEAFAQVYGAPRNHLLGLFFTENGSAPQEFMSVSETKGFTYWLFKHRVSRSDESRLASDTRKGLEQLGRMKGGWRFR